MFWAWSPCFKMSTQFFKSTVPASCPDLVFSPYKSTSKKAHVVDLVPFFYIMETLSKIGKSTCNVCTFSRGPQQIGKQTNRCSGVGPLTTMSNPIIPQRLDSAQILLCSLALQNILSIPTWLKFFSKTFQVLLYGSIFCFSVRYLKKDSSRASMERSVQKFQKTSIDGAKSAASSKLKQIPCMAWLQCLRSILCGFSSLSLSYRLKSLIWWSKSL